MYTYNIICNYLFIIWLVYIFPWVNWILWGECGRGIVGHAVRFETPTRKSKGWILLVALHLQFAWSLHCAYFLFWWWYKRSPVCSSCPSGIVLKKIFMQFSAKLNFFWHWKLFVECIQFCFVFFFWLTLTHRKDILARNFACISLEFSAHVQWYKAFFLFKLLWYPGVVAIVLIPVVRWTKDAVFSLTLRKT